MQKVKLVLLFALSVMGGIITGLAYAASVDPEVGLKALRLPLVAPFACGLGALAGAVFSPLFIWAFSEKDFWTAVPCFYAVSAAVAVGLNLVSVPFSELITAALIAAILLTYGTFIRSRT